MKTIIFILLIAYYICNPTLRTTDNLSCIIIGLEGLEKYFKTIQLKEKVNSNINNFKKEIKNSTSIK